MRLSATLLICLALLPVTACDREKPPGELLLVETAIYGLGLSEPSGLSMAADGQSFWTVSDHTNRVYRVGLDGSLIDSLSFEGRDLEAVCRISSGAGSLCLAEELGNELVLIDEHGSELERYEIHSGGNGNSGLEGVCPTWSGEGYFVLNEKEPANILKLGAEMQILETWTLDFLSDLSGICKAQDKGNYWILSDQSQKLVLWNPEGGLLQQYDLTIDKPEGVAVTPAGDLAIVSDSENRLYILSLKGAP